LIRFLNPKYSPKESAVPRGAISKICQDFHSIFKLEVCDTKKIYKRKHKEVCRLEGLNEKELEFEKASFLRIQEVIRINDFDEGLTPEKVDLDRGIGSEFWLPSPYCSERPNNQFSKILPRGKKLFVTSGREAIYQIIKSLSLSKEEKILLPSYLDWAILDPFVRASTEIRFYKIKKNLEIDLEDIQEKIDGKTKAILIIHYFGFPQPLTDIKKLKEKLLVIEDTTHSLFSLHEDKPSGSFGDISFASFRKMLPIPDGAMICYRNEHIPISDLPDQGIWHLNYKEKRELGLYYKGNFIRTGNKIHRKLSQIYFESAEELLQEIYTNPRKMSEKSKELLERLRIEEIINQRRKNFIYLLGEDFDEITPFHKNLPDGICPLGFPILSKNRNELEQHLIKKKVYSPVHWRLPNCINKDDYKISWDISNKILTIPIDQRYNLSHMEYIEKNLKKRCARAF